MTSKGRKVATLLRALFTELAVPRLKSGSVEHQAPVETHTVRRSISSGGGGPNGIAPQYRHTCWRRKPDIFRIDARSKRIEIGFRQSR